MKQFCKVFFSFFFLFSLIAFALWEKDYLNALKKFEKKDYIKAIKLLNRAVSERGNSYDKCIREGMFFYDYYPHFYLALNDMENFYRTKEIPKQLPFPNIFNEIQKLEEIADNMGAEKFPKLNLIKREFSAKFILLKKNWQEAKSERDRQIILNKAFQLKKKFENLIEGLRFANKFKILKDKIKERLDFYEKNKDKLSKENLKKLENLKLRINQIKEEDINLKESEAVLSELNSIPLEEKKLDYKNLKFAFKNYFQGSFDKAEENLKTALPYEKESPYFDFLITLIKLTRYYMDENKDSKLLEEASLSFKKAKEKGLKFENIKKFPLSPKILNQLKNL